MKKYIPNIITLFNLLSGLIALLFVFQQKWLLVFTFVILGILFDFADGLVARSINASSEMGLQLDSLADMVTSGVVPGFTMFFMIENSLNIHTIYNFKPELKYFLPFVGLLIILGSAWRLAKFNIDERQTSSFVGLPTPANALFIISWAVIIFNYENEFLVDLMSKTLVLIVISLLSTFALNMEVQLFSLKFKNFSLKNNKEKYILIIFSIIIFAWLKIGSIPIIIIFYILLSIITKKK